jgi:predicted small integral membrane protein
MESNNKFRFILRLDQIGVALIPAVIGILALLNDATGFTGTVASMVKPLITMAGNSSNQEWRALPGSLASIAYIFMFLGEFLMGVLATIGIILMSKNINRSPEKFEQSKCWVYIACGWGIIVWGLGFFEIGGDWFLSWMSSNSALGGFQQGGLNYALMIFICFGYLKLIRN